mgnify:CR=1 FL=1
MKLFIIIGLILMTNLRGQVFSTAQRVGVEGVVGGNNHEI